MNDVELLELWYQLVDLRMGLGLLDVPPELEHDICSAVSAIGDALDRFRFDWDGETSVWVDNTE